MRVFLPRKGLSILEITLASLILAIGLTFIYKQIGRQTALTIESEKIQMADKILESIKEELTGRPYNEVLRYADGQTPDSLGQYPLSDAMYPITFTEVLHVQKKYKDFSVQGSWMFLVRGDPNDRTIIQVEAKIDWTTDGGLKKERAKKFLLMAPK